MPNFGWSYPPGVTGRELEINGPDWEESWPDKECPTGHLGAIRCGYSGRTWFQCLDEDCVYFREPFGEDYLEDPTDWDAMIKDTKYDAL